MAKNNQSVRLPVYFISDKHLAGKEIELKNIEEQFSDKSEFELHLSYLKPQGNVKKNYDEWEQVVSIAKDALNNGDHVIILARSSHVFSKYYSFNKLLRHVVKANRLGSKILYGNAKSFRDALYLSENLFWVQDIEATTFVVIYRNIFETIIAHKAYALGLVCFETLLSGMTSNKHIFHPFAGYSNTEGGKDFESSSFNLKNIKLVTQKYKKKNKYLRSYQKDLSIPKLILNGTLRPSYAWDSSDWIFARCAKEQKIIVLVPFHNAGKFLAECYSSLRQQYYENYEVIFLDDCSTDNALDEISENQERIRKICGLYRRFALSNIYNCLKNLDCSGEEIIVIVDGDDYLYHNYVFKNINLFYQRQDCLLSYGQYYTTTNRWGHCRSYSREEFDILRQLDWRASHLKTFKFKLFKEYVSQDPEALALKDQQGLFYEMTYDIALMTPLLEIAGFERCYFNEDINYIYRIHERNDAARDSVLQMRIEQEIRTKSGFNQAF